MDLISERTFKIAKKINAFKFFSKDAGNEPYQKITINELISNILSLYQEKIRSYGIKLNVTLEIHPHFKFECKPTLTMQAFLYLLNNSFNAIKSKSQKWIHIHLKELDHDIEFSILDSSLRTERGFIGNQDVGLIPIKSPDMDEEEQCLENMEFLKGFIESQGGQVSLDATCENTKIIFFLPKEIAVLIIKIIIFFIFRLNIEPVF